MRLYFSGNEGSGGDSVSDHRDGGAGTGKGTPSGGICERDDESDHNTASTAGYSQQSEGSHDVLASEEEKRKKRQSKTRLQSPEFEDAEKDLLNTIADTLKQVGSQ